jgi:hypothetical protein
MELRLTDKERELLLELLNEQQKHLLHQINKASHYDFKVALRERCTLLEGIQQRLKEAIAPAA